MAGYLAVLMPMCCCFTSTVAGSPITPQAPHDHAQHGHRDAAGAGHHHQPHDSGRGEQAPLGHQHPCDPDSHEHDGECECGCSSGPAVFTVDAPVTLHLTFAPPPVILSIVDAPLLGKVATIRPPVPRKRSDTSLLQLHCALII